MSILIAHNLAQSYGHFDIFSGISGKIEDNHKVGLVGPNGVGKTSLLNVLAGLERPIEGGVSLAPDVTIGYLHQEAVQTFANKEHTIYEEMLSAFADLRIHEHRLRTLEHEMAEGNLSERLYAEYNDRLEAYEQAGGYEYETKIERITHNLGFAKDDLELPLTHLSGGQKTRALMARLLLEEPSLLILDEPTNHLDVQALEWLEDTLKKWEGAMLIVSHDRHFLNQVVNNVWEMSSTALESYRGNYDAYTKQRAERWARRQKEFEADQQRLTKEMAFIHKHIGSGRGRNMAFGKLRRLHVELDADGRALKTSRVKAKIKERRPPNGEWNRMKIHMDPTERSGEVVLTTHDLVVGYEHPLFVADDLQLMRGECAALVGPNGSGKSTFLRTLLEELPAISGTAELGMNLRIGYFAQAHNNLDASRSVIDEFLYRQHSSSAENLDMEEARRFLAQYLFQGDDVFKSVGELSGGERGRLALAILACQGANFLLLDEPTNHLDIPAQEVLESVLEQFDGTILLISHDRYLVRRLANQIWQIVDGQLYASMGSRKISIDMEEIL
ncbi:MAG: ABC-F family ATP-binding cassette domain-containing protein [Chloroflexota bacterium]